MKSQSDYNALQNSLSTVTHFYRKERKEVTAEVRKNFLQ
jgi:hypothetical protein